MLMDAPDLLHLAMRWLVANMEQHIFGMEAA
jgi:hypothetical protein